MEVPLLELKTQFVQIRREILAALESVAAGQQFILGQEVAALEQEIAHLCGVPYAVAVASGTDALLLSLRGLGVEAGDAVVTVPYSFFATAGTIWNLGARPLFIDIEETSFNLDPDCLERFLSRDCRVSLKAGKRKLVHKATGCPLKAVVPVHLFGQCADMDPILEIARRFDLAVIEDACQAIGGRYGNGAAGSFGDLGCFSFFPTKNLGGWGDGGMVVTKDRLLADRVRLLRTHGAQRRYYHSVVGFNSRLDEIQAAVLRVKLRRLEGWNRARQANARDYTFRIESAGMERWILPPAVHQNRTHVFHQYVVRCERRDTLRAFLMDSGIGCEIYYPVPLHEQECFRSLGYAPLDFPRSHRASQQALALPMYPELTEEQRSYVVEQLRAFYGAP